MTIKHFCDGTGKEADPADLIPIGHVVERLYLPEAAELAEAYLAERDALHTAVAEKWRKDFARLNAKYLKQLHSLPDYEPGG